MKSGNFIKCLTMVQCKHINSAALLDLIQHQHKSDW